MKTSIITFLLLICSELLAAEADHYTKRDIPLVDEAVQINAMANEYLSMATEKLNGEGSCNDSFESEKLLYKELRKYFSNHKKGKLVIDILNEDKVAKRVISLNDSVYGDWNILNGYLLGKPSAAKSPLALTSMIRIGDKIVGVDKLEHMFGMGHIYFKGHYLKRRNIRRVLKSGIFNEKTILGGNIIATGVFSYADLAANFNGMRFWNHILLKRADILGNKYNLGPYVRCSGGKWEVQEQSPIDFRNYFDDSMDESINCSKFATKKGLKKYTEKMNEIDSSFSCPMSNDAFEKMNDKYGVITPGDRKKRKLSHWILNDDGLGKVSYLNEF